MELQRYLSLKIDMALGKLVLIGGAEDRTNRKTILKKVAQLSDGRIGILTTALEEDPLEAYETYKKLFSKMGLECCPLDIRSRNEANEARAVSILDDIDTIFVTGGDQLKLSKILLKTKFFDKLISLINNKNINYCGTSAGAMIASNPIIYDNVRYDKGFGLINNIIVDTHFNERDRLKRIVQALLENRMSRGIGLDENSAILIDVDNAEVIGSRDVTFINIDNLFTNNMNEIGVDELMMGDGINKNIGNKGYKFDLKEWKVIK
jgi:cyanophycinase